MEILKLNTGGAVGSKIRLRRSAQNFCEDTVSSVLCAMEVWVLSGGFQDGLRGGLIYPNFCGLSFTFLHLL